MTSNGRDTLQKAALGFFSALVLLLIGLAFSANAETRRVDEKQDIELIQLRLSDSLQTVMLQQMNTNFQEHKAVLDSIWRKIRGVR